MSVCSHSCVIVLMEFMHAYPNGVCLLIPHVYTCPNTLTRTDSTMATHHMLCTCATLLRLDMSLPATVQPTFFLYKIFSVV